MSGCEDLVETAVLHQHPSELGVDQLWDVGVWCELMVGEQADDFGVDEVLAAFVSQSHPVVSVGDEVDTSDLEGGDGRELAVWESGPQLGHPGLGVAAAGSEVPVELADAVNRANHPF